VLSDAASLRAFVIEGAADAREYQVIVMSGSQVEGAVTPLKFTATATGAGASVAPNSAIDLSNSLRPESWRGPFATGGLYGARDRDGHMEFMIEAERELARVGARVSRKAPRARSPDARPNANVTGFTASAVPTVGEMLTFTSARQPDGSPSCDNGTELQGRVMSVGAHFVIVEEPAVAGHLLETDYDDINADLDAFVAAVGEAYFGEPADLDGNQRVIAFFNGEPNRRGVPYGGFFSPYDLADPADCANSNEAEILWLSGPDPDGELGPEPASAARTKVFAPSLIAHEYQHLLNAEQRVVLGSGLWNSGHFEESWLNEGMSHVAEEVSGLYRIGASTRSNYGYSEIDALITEPAVFATFIGYNFFQAVEYLGAPAAVPALTTGSLMTGALAARGWGYLFLRWLADRYAVASPPGIVPGSAEDALFRELSRGGNSHLKGVGNILHAINVVSGESPTWDDVLAQYFAAPAVDDAHAALSEDVQFRTWDLPRLYAELEDNPNFSGEYPLARVDIPVGPSASSTLTFDLGASTAQYFRFHSDGASPDMRAELTSLSGADAPSGARARVIVVRTR
jgi:hypothetical protein